MLIDDLMKWTLPSPNRKLRAAGVIAVGVLIGPVANVPVAGIHSAGTKGPLL